MPDVTPFLFACGHDEPDTCALCALGTPCDRCRPPRGVSIEISNATAALLEARRREWKLSCICRVVDRVLGLEDA